MSGAAGMSKTNKVGIIGAGQMGSGIAHSCALAGYQVTLIDIARPALDKATRLIEKNMSRQLVKGKIEEAEMQKALASIQTRTEFELVGECDLVIEAATENASVKTQIFEQICPLLPAETLLASNTSSLSITKLATATDRPEQFMGVHFMNLVPLMKLVELIRGLATSPETYDRFKAFVEAMGKITADAEDFPGFIVNRILMPMINEAVYALYEGVGNVKSIDQAMRLGANHPMGPLELADFIGLDTCLAIMQVLNEGMADSKYRPCPLLTKYVEAGWLGRKTGRGFYDYSSQPAMPTR